MKNKLLLVILGISAWFASATAQTVGTVTSGLFEPYGIAVDLSNNIYYFTDSANNQILRFDPATNLPPTEVAIGLPNPQGIAVDVTRGGLIVADTKSHVILFVGFNGGVSILAGQVDNPGNANGVGASAQFRYPYGVAADAEGNIYVADQQNNAVRKIDAGNAVTTFATGFNRPVGVAVGANGQVFVADTLNSQVKRFETNGTLSETVGGFNEPRGLLWVGGATGLLVSDAGNHTIRRVFSSLPNVRIAGVPGGGASLVDGPALSATFNSPIGLASDVNGVIVVADLYNKALRSINRVQLTPPWFSFPGGEYTNTVTVTFSNTLPSVGNVTYHYTTNDTNPTRFSPSAASVTLSGGPTVLQVLSVSPDAINSVIVTNTYTFAVAPLEMLIDGKTPAAAESSFNNDVTITNKTATLGATIHFTTNGEIPTTTNGFLWTDGVYNTNGILQLRGFRDGFTASGVLSNKFTFTVGTPVLLPAGGEFNNDTDLAIASKTTNAVFRYTQGAADPTGSSPTLTTTIIDEKLVITNYGTNGPLKILATRAGYNPSEIISNSFSFVVAPIFVEPAGGSFDNAVKVTFDNATQGDELYWTLNGSAPTTNNLKYVSPFDLGTNGTLRIKGFKNGYVSSATVTQVFNLSVATPVIEPAGATNSNNVTVKLKSDTDPVELYWTIDGSTPSKTNGTLYATGTPFSLGTNGLLKVIGIRDGFVSSEIASNVFSLKAANPKISPAGATNNNDITVTLSSTTPGADLYWTIDGTDPSPTNGVQQASGSSFPLGTNGTLKAVSVKNGFVDSQIISADFSLKVADPTISPAGITTNNTVDVELKSATTNGVRLYWTIDGSDPTESSALYSGKFTLGTNGVLKVKGFKDGYVSSAIVSSAFNLVVAKPKITPAGATNNNAVTVALESTTPGAQVYWTIDGSDPATNSALYAGSFSLATNGVLKARGFTNGFVASEIASAPFNLKVATPHVTPASGTNINTVTVTITNATDPVELRYTLDGTDPKTSSTKISTNTTVLSLSVTTNTALRVIGLRSGFVDSEEAVRALGIQVDKPVMNPPGGFFQDGTTLTLSVVRANASIYYTLNGGEPEKSESAGNFRYTNAIRLNLLSFSGNLKQVKAKAFAANAIPSETVSGQLATNNTLGVARDVNAGIGSTVVIPVVVGLKPDDVLKSLQFRVQVWPTSTNTPNLSLAALTALSVGTNDFIPVIGTSAAPGPIKFVVQTPPQSGTPGGILTNELILSFIGTDANFRAEDFATVNLLALTIPGTANVSNEFKIRILEPSGTSDGQQAAVSISPAQDRTITVTNISYIVGDSSPGGWYNAGDFGNGDLDNSDVNNAFYASLGLRVPYKVTDVFNAMDTFPEDENGFVGGDKQIRFLDWQILLLRSLRRETNNWTRSWTSGGVRLPASSALPVHPLGSGLKVAQSLATSGDAAKWFRPALLEAGSLNNVAPNSTVDVPIYASVKPGYSLAGLQFKAGVEANGPALEQPVDFIKNPDLPVARSVTGLLPATQTAYAWDAVLSGLNIETRQLLGNIRLTIPAGAQTGQSYTIRFANADGAPAQNPDGTFTQYDFESLPGHVWVGTIGQDLFGQLTDEWKANFFGSLNNALAQALADPDADGVPNWQEYLAGSNPTQLRFHLQSGAEWDQLKQNLKLKWFALPGQVYSVESSTDIASGNWREVARILGNGDVKEVIDPNASGRVQFYRIRVQQP
ncbi:MAG: chitobiase/beta-hexosaminidase C-terminal domain-containing protein [Verrucomicrobiota bacterium]